MLRAAAIRALTTDQSTGGDQNIALGSAAFIAGHCELIVPHGRLECETTEGAGSELKWFVMIGNQVSESPSTNYAPPEIERIVGLGSDDASTEGGDRVILIGRNFGPPGSVLRASTASATEMQPGKVFLDSVSFGPTGSEYVARSCIVLNHTGIECETAAGIGRNLRWVVTVEGQSSSTTRSPMTRYAAPEIVSLRLPSTGASTAGGGLASIVVRNRGLAARARVQVFVNSRGLIEPSDAQGAWADMLRDGSAISSESKRWLATMPSPTVTNGEGDPIQREGKEVRLDFVLPPGFGQDRQIIVKLTRGIEDSAVSNDTSSAAFSSEEAVYSALSGFLTYDPPEITRVAPDRNATMGNGWLRVFVQGNNFCDGRDGCGQVLIDGRVVSPVAALQAVGDTVSPRVIRWTHDEIELETPDPNVGGTSSST